MKWLDNLDAEKRKLYIQFIKFSFVGTTSFFIDFGLMVALVEWCHFDPMWAAGISYVVSLIYNYVLSMKMVFTHREDMSRKKEVILFFVLSGIGLVLCEMCMYAGEVVCVGAGLDYKDGPYYMLVKLVADTLVGFWNFYSRKKWLDADSAK